MEEKYLKYLRDKLQEDIDMRVEALSSGKAGDFPAYCTLTGHIRGLRDSQRHIDDLVQRLKDNDEQL